MTVDVCFQDAKSLYGSTTVPEKMIGCWERLYIRFSDGTEDKTTRVIWLQNSFWGGRYPYCRLAAKPARTKGFWRLLKRRAAEIG